MKPQPHQKHYSKLCLWQTTIEDSRTESTKYTELIIPIRFLPHIFTNQTVKKETKKNNKAKPEKMFITNH